MVARIPAAQSTRSTRGPYLFHNETVRNPDNAFHLAIPCADLDDAESFYAGTLGCRVGRRMEDRITFDFFGDQLVCHLSPERIDVEPEMYPRHFGITFRAATDFDALLERCRSAGASFFTEPFVRFEDTPAEHRTFFLQDPSNNLLEFKAYRDAEMMY